MFVFYTQLLKCAKNVKQDRELFHLIVLHDVGYTDCESFNIFSVRLLRYQKLEFVILFTDL